MGEKTQQNIFTIDSSTKYNVKTILHSPLHCTQGNLHDTTKRLAQYQDKLMLGLKPTNPGVRLSLSHQVRNNQEQCATHRREGNPYDDVQMNTT